MTPNTSFTPNTLVLMRNRFRDCVVRVAAVKNGRVQVFGTSAEFDATTGQQVSHPNCWAGWRIEAMA